jgi:hypothetical protein
LEELVVASFSIRDENSAGENPRAMTVTDSFSFVYAEHFQPERVLLGFERR